MKLKLLFILILSAFFIGCTDGSDDSNNYYSSNNYNNSNYNDGGVNNNTQNLNNSNNQNNTNNTSNTTTTNNTTELTPEELLELLCQDAPEEEVTYFMSADDSGSQAHAMLAKHNIQKGSCYYLMGNPPREYEFLNYYSFNYERPAAGSLGITPQMMLDNDGMYKLLVGVVSESREIEDRRSLHFVFSIDTSGSMSGEPLENVKHVLRALAPRMRVGDIVSLVEWSNTQEVLLEAHEVSGPNDLDFLNVVNNLASSGSTDLHAGLVTAYDLANQYYSAERLTRVFLVSDGGANTGITDEEIIGNAASMQEGEGIFMIGIGTSDYYNHQLMDRVTDLGRGAYVYVNDETAAYEVFSEERFLSNVDVAALGVRLEVTLPPAFIVAQFHGEEISTNPDEVRPQHLAPNDAMLYHSSLADCGSEDPASETVTFRVTWMDPLTRNPMEETISITIGELLEGPVDKLLKSNLIVNYARWIAGLEVYESEELDRATQKSRLLEELQTLYSETQDEDLSEIISLLGTCN
ncbi:VWA domain-containing protein [Myxococcota bacterium]|nr:VWA domain-containing protein [Myxococcota bacterium]MBU1380157.1 VWA domain-containing protein [Myxococcota bacterium]MBU1496332.1 VWA domain-containing protein [Myxococcota bacterium]